MFTLPLFPSKSVGVFSYFCLEIIQRITWDLKKLKVVKNQTNYFSDQTVVKFSFLILYWV